MAKQFRKLDQLMLSLGDKEASYDAGPAAWTAGSAVQLFAFGDAYVEWDDQIVSDRDTIHGSQFATISEIIRQDARLAYAEPLVRPTHLGGLAALAGGVVAVAQDGVLVAYRHKVTPVAADVALPSIGMIEKASGEQYKYGGLCLESFRLTRGGPNNAYHSIEAGLVGSGTRAADATAFVTKGGESALTWGKTKCWLETGTNIAIAATPAQGAENISDDTPDNLSARLLNYEFRHTNALQLEDGYFPGSGKVRGRLDHGGARGAHISLTLIVNPATLATERAYYENRDAVAIEINQDSGVIIASTGVFKFGFILIIPKLHLEKPTRGTQEDFNIITLEGDAMDDGTNPLWQLYTYNAYAAYLA
jgi:hypothetical protein